MKPTQDSNSSRATFTPEELAAVRRKVAAHLERLRYLKERIMSNSATPEEREEYEDETWWEGTADTTRLWPEGTPNPWERPRPPKEAKDGDAS